MIAELDGCDARLLSNPPCIRLLMRRAAEEAGATLLADEVFEFQNGGVSGFVLLAESHISIHTWPEHRYAALDIFTCGQHTLPDMACAYLMKHLGATDVRVTAMERGVPTKRGSHEHHVAPPRVGMVGPVLANLPNSA